MSKAKTLNDEQLDRLLDAIAATSKYPERDLVMVLLSFKAGLRACEIAGLTWRNVTDAVGAITNVIEIPATVAKYGKPRALAMHPLVREALVLWHEAYGREMIGKAVIQPARTPGSKDPIIISLGHGEQDGMSANTLQKYMGRLFRRHGYDASSHSGRRTLLTKLARMTGDFECSLFDVQEVAGHSSVGTTQAYVELSPNAAAMLRSA